MPFISPVPNSDKNPTFMYWHGAGGLKKQSAHNNYDWRITNQLRGGPAPTRRRDLTYRVKQFYAWQTTPYFKLLGPGDTGGVL